MRIAGTLFACLLSVAAISGCKSRMVSCKTDNSKDYAGAKEVPPLTAPPGLEVPNTRNSLKVPPLNTPERIRGRRSRRQKQPRLQSRSNALSVMIRTP